MEIKKIIDFENVLISSVLKNLLKDKSTKKNIVWATDTYSSLGTPFFDKKQITENLLKGWYSDIIQPRAFKTAEKQIDRTRKKAEVFTPAWLCNRMNNIIDDEWFGYANVFNIPTEKGWITNKEKIKFQKENKWKEYIDSRRLEITCGEAPYIVSRYDASTGEIIDINNRIGLLDRKLRIVNENTSTEEEWFKWTMRAFQSVYGYEYQGDNLLIARLNLLMTFIDYVEMRWDRKPTLKEISKIANIISWNFWQMNGLNGTVPMGKPEETYKQLTFEDIFSLNNKEEIINCKIYDWRKRCSLLFQTIEREEKCSMKFDYVIGNPPYQEVSSGGKKADDSIYNFFMDEAYKISDKAELITPARFLFDNGNTPKEWNRKILEDEHFKVLMFDNDSSKYFSNTDIKGGIAIHYRDSTKKFGAIKQFTAFQELNSILKKVLKLNEISITTIIYNQNKFDLHNLYEDYSDLKNIISSNGKEKRLTSGCINYKCFSENRISDNDIKILGVMNNKRVYKYINQKYLDKNDNNLNFYKVIVPANNGSGAIGEVISTPLIGTPLIGYTQTFISFGCFEEKYLADNALKYIKTKFCRTMLGVLKVTQNGKKDTWKYVPIQDFSNNSDVNWNCSVSEIDKQLYKKYNLSEDEINFIEEKVKEME